MTEPLPDPVAGCLAPRPSPLRLQWLGVDPQPELVPVPPPTRDHPGRCWLPTRYGAVRPCLNAASGTVRDWLAPLDLAQSIPACAECAEAFGYDLERF